MGLLGDAPTPQVQTMEDIAGLLGKYLTRVDQPRIDNYVFRLHYRVTFSVLLACMVLVSTTQYFGDPIKCMADGVPEDPLNLFCWIHSSFSVPSRLGTTEEEYGVGNHDQIAQHQPHPGVAPVLPGE